MHLVFLFLAAAASQVDSALVADRGGVFVVLVRLCAGLLGGLGLAWVLKNRFRQWHHTQPKFRAGIYLVEKLLVLAVGVATGYFELWKRASFVTNERFLLTVYIAVGFGSALSIALPYLVSLAKDDDKATIKRLEGEALQSLAQHELRIEQVRTEAAQARAQRDSSIEAVGAISAVIEAKKQRLAETAVKKACLSRTAFTDALGPKVQVFMLMKSLHQQFARHIPAPGELRVGVYMRSPEDAQQLAPLYSWDGAKESCFKNSHEGFMRLDAPGGAQSLVVHCFHSDEPLHIIEDCAKAAEQNKFVFFYPAQRDHLKSMVAYRHNLLHAGRPDALILTMDTDHASFFSVSRRFQCELVLKETARRIELELIALDLIQKLPIPDAT